MASTSRPAASAVVASPPPPPLRYLVAPGRAALSRVAAHDLADPGQLMVGWTPALRQAPHRWPSARIVAALAAALLLRVNFGKRAPSTAYRQALPGKALGTWDPIPDRYGNKHIQLKSDRIHHWLSVGAEPSERVAWLLSRAELTPPRRAAAGR